MSPAATPGSAAVCISAKMALSAGTAAAHLFCWAMLSEPSSTNIRYTGCLLACATAVAQPASLSGAPIDTPRRTRTPPKTTLRHRRGRRWRRRPASRRHPTGLRGSRRIPRRRRPGPPGAAPRRRRASPSQLRALRVHRGASFPAICVSQPSTIDTFAVRLLSALVQAAPCKRIAVGIAALSYVHPFLASCKMVVPLTCTFTCVGSTVFRLLDCSGNVHETTCPRMALSAVSNCCCS